MNIASLLRACVATFAFITAAHASAIPVLQVTNGVLTGATGVEVGGQKYDVRFVDGSCASLFNNCTASSFTFKTVDTARAASQALLNDVYVDGPAGNFDSNPLSVFGCADGGFFCFTLVPYELNAISSFFNSAFALNNSNPAPSADYASNSAYPVFTNYATTARYNFAIFSVQPAAVPEPGTFALMGLAMAGLAFSRRRKS